MIQQTLNLDFTRSRQLAAEGSEFSPKGVPNCKWWLPEPFFVKGAEGSRIFDVDGNEYLDYWCGAGPLILGHNHPVVSKAAIDAIQQGNVQFCMPALQDVALARRLNEYIPCAERVVFCTTGTDATTIAVRIARAYTGKTKVAKFDGGNQGWSDALAVNNAPASHAAGQRAGPTAVPESAGVPPQAIADTVVLPYNDLDAVVHRLKVEREGLACVLVEPMIHGKNLLPVPGFLSGLRQACDDLGIVLVFDEIVTGFRHGLSGGQGVVGVTPDLAAFGKALASGFIISAVCGKKELMSLVAPEGNVQVAGTFGGNALSTSVALKTLDVLAQPGFYDRLFEKGDYLRNEINRAAEQLGVKAQCHGYGSVWCMYFSDRRPVNNSDVVRYLQEGGSKKDTAYRAYMLNHRIFIRPQAVNRAYISAAHTWEDIQRAVDITRDFLAENKSALK